MSSSGITDRSRRARLKSWLGTRGAVGWIAALGALLTTWSLAGGLAADDFLQAVALRHLPLATPMSGPLDLFRFANGDPKTTHALMETGQFQWIATPTLRFAFFRPLSAATHVFDYALWPNSPWVMHAENVALYAVAIVAAGAVYRRFIQPAWLAGFALLLFAVDHSHGPAVAWIANRNAILALSLGLPILLLHDRWRRDGWKPGRWLGVALLVPALLAGESAVAVCAYLAAYAIHLERGSWRSRIEALVPYGVVVILWRIAYTALGYGVAGSGLYTDPGHTPLAFVGAVGRRLPFLLLGELALPQADLADVYEYIRPSSVAWMLGYAVVVLALLAAAAFRTWRRSATARFFVTGFLLAGVPVCAAFASDRLLLFVSVGAMGLVAEMIVTAIGLGERVAAAFLVLIHLIIAPPFLVFRARTNDLQLWIDAGDKTIPRTPEIASKTVLIANPPNDLFVCYTPALRAVRGEPRPEHVWGLANVVERVDVTRVDDRTLRVRPEQGFFPHAAERMLRADIRGLPVGSVVTLDEMTVTVTAVTGDGRPAEALFRFDRSLEDPSFVWLSWTRKGFAPWTPPPLGETAHLPAHDVRRAMLDIEDALTDRLP